MVPRVRVPDVGIMTPAATNVLPFRADAAQAMSVRRYPLRNGDAGIGQTILFMRGAVQGNEGASNPTVRQQALTIARGLDARDKQGQIAAVLDWVKSNIEFRGEDGEVIQTPLVTLQLKAGDCDDHSTLIAAMLRTLGFQVRFNTVAADASDPNEFTHVFAEVLDPTTGQWTAMDSTVPGSYPGWRPKNVYRARAWKGMRGMGDAFTDSGGGGDLFATDIAPLIQPLDQALAYKIQGTPPVVGNFSFGNLFSPTPTGTSGVPWSWIVIGGFALLLVTQWRHR
jgi:Transglutaminase-like superfamily